MSRNSQGLSYLHAQNFGLKETDLTKSDFASMLPFSVSTLEFLPQNNDITVRDPFEEPDEFFLRRQKEDNFETYSQ